MVLSTFGVMFTRSAKAAAGLRVSRSGGRISLANWTPEGLYQTKSLETLSKLPRHHQRWCTAAIAMGLFRTSEALFGESPQHVYSSNAVNV
jgi:hypothetical protein